METGRAMHKGAPKRKRAEEPFGFFRPFLRIETLCPYGLARLEEHIGELREKKRSCKELDCERRRIRDTAYCLEHHIAARFGRQLSRL